MAFLASINGVITPAEEARVSVLDTGFTFGDSVYEVLRTYDGLAFEPGRHFRRLRASASRLGIEVPLGDTDLLSQLDALVARGGDKKSYIRIVVTRGLGDCSYHFERVQGPTVVMIVKPLPCYPDWHYERGIDVVSVGVRRNHPLSLDPGIKSSNLLNNVQAVREARARGAEEAVLLNLDGFLAEGASSNVFAVRHGIIRTPPLSAGILPGITREVAIELLAALGLPLLEEPLRLEDLELADEAFLTSTTREVVPVSRLDERPIGAGRPGPLTLRTLRAFRGYAPSHCGAASLLPRAAATVFSADASPSSRTSG